MLHPPAGAMRIERSLSILILPHALHRLSRQPPVWSNFGGQLWEIPLMKSCQPFRRRFSLQKSAVQGVLRLGSRKAALSHPAVQKGKDTLFQRVSVQMAHCLFCGIAVFQRCTPQLMESQLRGHK